MTYLRLEFVGPPMVSIVRDVDLAGDDSESHLAVHVWHPLGMSYVLGSEAESAAFSGDGIEYQPAGLAHAVDTEAPTNPAEAILGYAICGVAVRVWPDQPFDPTAAGVHDHCAALAHPQ